MELQEAKLKLGKVLCWLFEYRQCIPEDMRIELQEILLMPEPPKEAIDWEKVWKLYDTFEDAHEAQLAVQKLIENSIKPFIEIK